MEKGAYKTAKRPQVKKKKEKKKEKKQRKSDRERIADFREKPIIIRWPYLWNPPLDHAEFSVYCSYHTSLLTDRRDWKYTCREVWSPADFYLFHRWIILILGYVVRLDVSFILDGGDWKLILWQGFVHVEQQLVHFQVSSVLFRSREI